VESSLRGDLLAYADGEYVRTLIRGTMMIEASLIVMVLGTMVVVGLSFVSMLAAIVPNIGQIADYIQPISRFTQLGNPLNMFAGTLLWTIGWWMLSQPDPAVRISDRGDRPRRVLRVVLLINIAASLLLAALAMFFPTIPMGVGGVGAGGGRAVVAPAIGLGANFGAGIISFVAWAIQFFASMMYIKWLARRIPSVDMYSRGKVYMWVLPLVYILVCGVGQLIAFIMYFILMDQLRSELKRVVPVIARTAGAKPISETGAT
jgi:hypothetical protein